MGNSNLIALEIFKTVVEQGGIAKAANRLRRVPSNVTTRVKQLEERLKLLPSNSTGRCAAVGRVRAIHSYVPH